MEIAELARIIGGFIALVAVGWLLRRSGILKPEDAKPINAVIVYAGLPAMIFRAVHPATLDVGLIGIAVVAWVSFAAALIAAWLAARVLRVSRPVAGGLMLAAALGNTGYIGYPVSQALLGEQGLVRAVFFDVFGTVMALLFVGLIVAERYGAAEGERPNPLKEALTFPAVIAVIVALALHPFTVPAMVGDWIDALANVVVPLIMISVGLSLRPGSLREHAAGLAVVGGIRLLLAPAVALAAGLLMVRDPAAVDLTVLEAGMPTMMLTLVIGQRFGLDTDFIASAILVTTVASVITIPLLQLLARVI